MKSRHFIRLYFSLVLSSSSGAVLAADIVWTNVSGGNWGNPANWSPNLVPGPPDNAQITNAGSYIVGLDVDATVRQLIIGGATGTQTLTHVAGSTLTLRVSSTIGTNGIYQLPALAALDGAGDLFIEGTLQWEGGIMLGSGRTILPEGHNLTIGGSAFKTLARGLDLSGDAVLQTSLSARPGGEIRILPSGSLNFLDGSGLGSGVGGVVNNLGTVRKSGAGPTSLGFGFNNQGLVSVSGGALNLLGGGISSGGFEVADGTALTFGGSNSVGNSVVFTSTGSGIFRVMSGTFNVASDLTINSPFELAGTAVLAGDGDVTFAGGVHWLGGTMQGRGKTIIPAQAALTIEGLDYGKVLLRDLDLQGVGSLNGSYLRANFFGGNDAALTIFEGATFDLLSDQRLMPYGPGDSAVIRNFGTVRTLGGGEVDIGFVFNNAGSVKIEAGLLSLTNGGLHSGTFETVNGTLINFGGGVHVVNAGAAFAASGSGFYRVNGGTFRLSTNLTMNPTFELTAEGILDGESTITFDNTFNWAGGTMRGAGRTIIAQGTRMAILGNSFDKTLLRPLDLGGNGSISGTGKFFAGAGATFTILPTGTFDLLDNPAMTLASLGEIAQLNNQGVLRKPEGSGVATLGFKVANSGLVSSVSGMISLDGGYLQTAGSTALSGGDVGGNFLDLQGGQLVGTGTIAANVRSSADIFPGSPVGFLGISNATAQTFTATADGTMNIQIGGLSPGSQHDQFRVSGLANLGGPLNIDLINGFVPTPGNTFTVMTYSARSGKFSSVAAPPGVFFSVTYLPTSVVLTSVPEESILTDLHALIGSGFVGTSTNRAFKLTMTGEPGRLYEVYSQTNVAAPFANWEFLGLMTAADRYFEFRDPIGLDPSFRFYRARQRP